MTSFWIHLHLLTSGESCKPEAWIELEGISAYLRIYDSNLISNLVMGARVLLIRREEFR